MVVYKVMSHSDVFLFKVYSCSSRHNWKYFYIHYRNNSHNNNRCIITMVTLLTLHMERVWVQSIREDRKATYRQRVQPAGAQTTMEPELELTTRFNKAAMLELYAKLTSCCLYLYMHFTNMRLQFKLSKYQIVPLRTQKHLLLPTWLLWAGLCVNATITDANIVRIQKL